MVKITSAAAATAWGSSAQRAPRASSGSAFARVRLWTVAREAGLQQMAAHAGAHHAGADPADAGLCGCDLHQRIRRGQSHFRRTKIGTVPGLLPSRSLIPAIFGPPQDLADHDGLADAVGIGQHLDQAGQRQGRGRQGGLVGGRRRGGFARLLGQLADVVAEHLLQAMADFLIGLRDLSAQLRSAAAEFSRVEVRFHLLADLGADGLRPRFRRRLRR